MSFYFVFCNILFFCCNDNEGGKQYKSQKDSIFVSQIIYNGSVKLPIKIEIPETNKLCVIDILSDVTNREYTKKRYFFCRNSELLTLYLNYERKIDTILGSNTFIIPYSIHSSGFNTYYYIGLFRRTDSGKEIVQTSTCFLGDRIKLKSIKLKDDNCFVVDYLIHTIDQAMDEKPSVQVSKRFSTSNQKLFSFSNLE